MLRLIFNDNKKLLIHVLLTYGVLVITALLFVRPQLQMVVGLTFGTLVAVLNFFEMALTFYRAVHMPSYKAQQFAVFKYMMRFTLTGGVLLVSFLSPSINPLGTILGLLIIKGVLYLTQLNKNNGSKEQKFMRKEE